VIVAVMLAASGCSLLPQEEEVLQPPLMTPQRESYNLYEVQRGTITKSISGPGEVEASVALDLRFARAGTVSAVHAKLGDEVKQGDPILELDRDGLDITVLERQRDFEMAQYTLNQAKASRDEELIRIRMLELGIAEQRLNDARAQWEGSVLTAPIDGRITFMDDLRPGDRVQEGDRYAALIDPESLRLKYVSAAVTELLEVQVGMKATVTIGGREVEATVVQSPSSAPVTDDERLNRELSQSVYFTLDDPAVEVRLEDSVRIEIILQQKDNVILIPRSALHTLSGRNFVRVLEGESIREMDVEKGIESQFEIEIAEGLSIGQRLILP